MKKKVLWTLTVGIVATLGLFACTTSRAGYETAPYTVVEKVDSSLELRDYPALTIVSTAGRGRSADGSFMRLFRYIQGENQGQAQIDMTTPVFMDRQDDQATTMSFVMPASVAAKGAPAPKAESVSLTQRPAGRYAVLRFTGSQSTDNEKAALTRLQDFLKTRSLQATGPATFAYYDPPWTPGPLRRNEVLLPLKQN